MNEAGNRAGITKAVAAICYSALLTVLSWKYHRRGTCILSAELHQARESSHGREASVVSIRASTVSIFFNCSIWL